MGILKKLSILLLGILPGGCYDDFTPKIDVKPVLCLNARICAGEAIEPLVTRSWLYTDVAGEEDHSVSDSQTKLYVNGEVVDAGYIPKEGDRIRIVVDSPTYGKAESEVKVPSRPVIKDVKWKAEATSAAVGSDNDEEMNGRVLFNILVELTVDDSAAEDNYYNLSYHGYNYNPEDYSYFGIGQLQYDAEPIFSEHISVFESFYGADAYGFTFFSDRQFAGGCYTLTLQFSNLHYSIHSPVHDDRYFDLGLVLYLSSISDSFYKYANYQWQVTDGIVGDLGDVGLGDPIWGYSNVSTGAGVVVAESYSSYTIDLHDFIKQTLESAPKDDLPDYTLTENHNTM